MTKMFFRVLGAPLLFGLLMLVTLSPLAVASSPKASISHPLATKMVSIVDIKGGKHAFKPKKVTITAGTTVTWTNKSAVPHTVTSDTGLFDSGVINPGATFSFTFTTAGTYKYHCNFHLYMHGTVIVH